MSVLDSLRAAMHTRLSDMTESAYRTENWHSATFDGTRHVFRFDVPSDVDVAGFERDIAEADIPLSRGFVADIDVTESSAGQIEVAALIIEA